MEEGRGPDLKPGPGTGINYALPINKIVPTNFGFVHLDGVINVGDKVYVKVTSINSPTNESALNAIHEALDQVNSEGFDGIHISDTFNQQQLDTIIRDMDMTSIKLETRPDTNGHTIERLVDDAKWNYVSKEEAKAYNPDEDLGPALTPDSVAEKDLQNSLNQDVDYRNNQQRMSLSSNVSKQASRLKKGLKYAAECISKNG